MSGLSRPRAARRVRGPAAVLALALLSAGCGGGTAEGSGDSTAAPAGSPADSTGDAAGAGDATGAGASEAPTSGETDEGPVGSASPSASAGRSAGASVEVVMTYGSYDAGSGSVRVGGFAEVLAEDGTCVLTLSRPGHADVTAEGPASPDATSAACGELAVDGARLAPGPWTARLEYRSSGASGRSGPSTIELP